MNKIIKKISEMEKLAYADYLGEVARNGEESKRTQELKFRHLGILEAKKGNYANVISRNGQKRPSAEG